MGGGSGIGRATAIRLAANGAAVAVADLRAGSAEEVVSGILATGGAAVGLECDVTQEDSVSVTVERAAAELDGIDGLVAGPGIASHGGTHLLTLDDWDMVMRVNLTGVFLTLKHSIPFLLSAGRGSIVTIGSVASFLVTGQNAISYAASKAAVVALTRGVAVEYAGRAIRANCVCPGAVDTNIAAHSRALRPLLSSPRGETFRYHKDFPLARTAEAEEIAPVIEFLIGDGSSYITGASVMADGGYTSV